MFRFVLACCLLTTPTPAFAEPAWKKAMNARLAERRAKTQAEIADWQARKAAVAAETAKWDAIARAEGRETQTEMFARFREEALAKRSTNVISIMDEMRASEARQDTIKARGVLGYHSDELKAVCASNRYC